MLHFLGLRWTLLGIGEGVNQTLDLETPRLPLVSAVRVVLDRKATARSTTITAALGPHWSGARAAHNLHLDHPEATLATVRDLVARASIAT